MSTPRDPAHDHTSLGHTHSGPGADRRRLVIAMAIIGAVVVIQVVGALLSGSLSLLADSGHMLSDLIGLTIALIASVIAARPATDRYTFGFRRWEVFGAAANAGLLTVVALVVAAEGIRRLIFPEEVEVLGGPMLLVAVLGLAANLAALLVLRGRRDSTMNMRGAYLEVLGDTIGSIAVIIASIVIITTGFATADAIASLVIAALIVPRAAVLLRDVVAVLSQSAPTKSTVPQLRDYLTEQAGVVSVHDVHVWQVAPGDVVFSAHIVVDDAVIAADGGSLLLTHLRQGVAERFELEHATFQFEAISRAACETPLHR